MSIVLGDELKNAGREPAEVLADHEGFALAAITAKTARENNQSVARDPLPEEPAHGLVIGKKNAASRRMAREAEWVISPPNDLASNRQL